MCPIIATLLSCTCGRVRYWGQTLAPRVTAVLMHNAHWSAAELWPSPRCAQMRAHVCGHMFFGCVCAHGFGSAGPCSAAYPAGLSKSGEVPKRSDKFLLGRHVALGAGTCSLKVRPVVQFPSPVFRVALEGSYVVDWMHRDFRCLEISLWPQSLFPASWFKMTVLSNSAGVHEQMTREKLLTSPMFSPGPPGLPGPPGTPWW